MRRLSLDLLAEYGGQALLQQAQALGITVDWYEDHETPDDSPFEIDSNYVIHIDAFLDSTAAEALDTALRQAIRLKTSQSSPPGVNTVPATAGLTPVTYQQAITPVPDTAFDDFLDFLLNITWGLPNTLVGGTLAVLNITASLIVVPINRKLGGTMTWPHWEMYGNDLITLEGGITDLFNADLTIGGFGLLSDGLGPVNVRGGNNVTFIEHMEGHNDQSCLLGPLYLPVVGTTSFFDFLFGSGRAFSEDWANDWGTD